MKDLERKAFERIKTASQMSLRHYGRPLVCAYSGGKDSDALLELLKRSGEPFEAHHSLTTADAPQTVAHIREAFRRLELQGIKCGVDFHKRPNGGRVTMWNLIPAKLLPPTRRVRYCCSVLKESGCENRMIATGVRRAESGSRAKRAPYEAIGRTKKDATQVSDEKMLLTDNDDSRRLFERCQIKAKTAVNPIIDWRDADVWEYIRSERIRVNPLYECGYHRVGCVGCPMAGKARWKEFGDFPKIKRAYIRAFEKMLQVRRKRGLPTAWKTGEDVFMWWMEDDSVPGQMTFEWT